MTYEASVIVAAIVLVAAAVFLIATYAAKKRAAQEEALKQQASTRGWTFETERRGRCRVRRWRGSQDGVAWMAESSERPGGHNRRPIRLAHWRTTPRRGPAAPIVCMGVPKGRETPSLNVAQDDSMFAHLATKIAGFALDKAIDSYFGDDVGRDVDAAVLKPVPGTAIPGFIVMAADIEAASRVLFQGLTKALTAGTADPHSVFGTDNRPWVLLWKDGVSLGRTRAFDTTDDVEKFVRAGSALARLPIA
jgi:hypothetical protein